jgi:hypothetical protein
MTPALPDTLGPTEFNALIESHAARSEPDTLSFEAFDQAARRLIRESIDEQSLYRSSLVVARQ